eukprot:ctg_2817.g559
MGHGGAENGRESTREWHEGTEQGKIMVRGLAEKSLHRQDRRLHLCLRDRSIPQNLLVRRRVPAAAEAAGQNVVAATIASPEHRPMKTPCGLCALRVRRLMDVGDSEGARERSRAYRVPRLPAYRIAYLDRTVRGIGSSDKCGSLERMTGASPTESSKRRNDSGGDRARDDSTTESQATELIDDVDTAFEEYEQLAISSNQSDSLHRTLSPDGRYVRLSQLLDWGSTKRVYAGIDTVDAIEVAWSDVVIHAPSGSEEELKLAKECSLREMAALRKVQHLHIVHLYDAWEREPEDLHRAAGHAQTASDPSLGLRAAASAAGAALADAAAGAS